MPKKTEDAPPAPTADVVTPDPPERATPAYGPPSEREVLLWCLRRLAALHGAAPGNETADVDTSQVATDAADLVAWAKGARLP